MKNRMDVFLFSKQKIILNQIRKKRLIIYGAQAIKKQIGMIARPTEDYDIFSINPKKHARQLERKLDKKSRGDFYYVKPALHPGTFKVMYKGADERKGTKDDLTIADFTIPKRKLKIKVIEGVKYVDIREAIKDKLRILSEKQYAFRHPKDRADLQRIRFAQSLKRAVR